MERQSLLTNAHMVLGALVAAFFLFSWSSAAWADIYINHLYVTLLWAPNAETEDVAGYEIYRASSYDGPYEKAHSGLITGVSWTDTTVQEGGIYYYELCAIDIAGNVSAFSGPSDKIIISGDHDNDGYPDYLERELGTDTENVDEYPMPSGLILQPWTLFMKYGDTAQLRVTGIFTSSKGESLPFDMTSLVSYHVSAGNVVSVNETGLVRAISVTGETTTTIEASATIWSNECSVIVDNEGPTVFASPSGGSFSGPVVITLSANEPSTIFYTVDGSNPSQYSPVYSVPLVFDSFTTLKCCGVDALGNVGPITIEVYSTDALPPVLMEDDLLPYPNQGFPSDMGPMPRVSVWSCIRARLFDESGIEDPSFGNTRINVRANGIVVNGSVKMISVRPAIDATDVWLTFISDQAFAYGATIDVKITCRDLAGNEMANSPYAYSFRVESEPPILPLQTEVPEAVGDRYMITAYGEDIGLDGIPGTFDFGEGNGLIDTEDANGDGILDQAEDSNSNGKIDTEDTDSDGILDGEIRIEYSANELVQPFIGDPEELPESSIEGYPHVFLNLQPIAVFDEPVKVFIEIPWETDLQEYKIYLYEPKPDPDPSAGWRRATIGDGWLEYRENHGPNDGNPMEPATIELWVNHFSAVGCFPASGAEDDGGGGGGARGSIRCFIATAAYGSCDSDDVLILRQFRDTYLLNNVPGRLFVQAYYHTSPPIADFIVKHDNVRTAVRHGLSLVSIACKFTLTCPRETEVIIHITLLVVAATILVSMRSIKSRKPHSLS